MIKRMLKFMLFALLLGAYNIAFSQDGVEAPKVVKLKDGTELDWKSFATALNTGDIKGAVSKEVSEALQNAKDNYYGNADKDIIGARPDSIEKARAYAIAKSNYETALGNLAQWEGELAVLPVIIPQWLTVAYTNSQRFNQAYEELDPGAENYKSDATFYYALQRDIKNKGNYILYMSFGDSMPENGAGFSASSWSSGNPLNFFYLFVNDGGAYHISGLNVYLGSGYANASPNTERTTNLTVAYSVRSNTPEYIPDLAFSAISAIYNNPDYVEGPDKRIELTNNIKTLIGNAKDSEGNEILVDGKTISQLNYLLYLRNQAEAAAEVAKAAAVEALAKLQSAERAYATAEANANVTAVDNYNNITLLDNVTVDTQIEGTYTGTINGNGKVITIPSGNAINIFRGHIYNAAVNGTLSVATSGSNIENVAVWYGSDGEWYDNDVSASATTYENLAALGFAARKYFGVNLEADDELTNLTDSTRVFDITIYEPNATTQCYSNLKGGVFVNATKTIGDNTFVYSATNDFGSINNVFVGGSGKYSCASVNITDSKTENFYCPVELTAERMCYSRTFKAGYNSVCLPFDLKASDFGKGAIVSKYDKETPTQFWFTKVATTIPANTPALIKIPENQSVTLSDISGVTLKPTDKSQIVVDEGSKDEPSKIYGTFKYAYAGEFAGESNTNKIYGLQGGKFTAATYSINPDDEQAHFPAFRVAIWTAINKPVSYDGSYVDSREIVIVDEDGSVFIDNGSSLVENVKTDESSLKVEVGPGEIVITTGVDYGKVQVYNLNGGVVAIADVMAGTTSVKIEKGIYIVMGKKVMVK